MMTKAVCCITDGEHILIFRHPTSGYQIPKGTVEEHESPEAAATREAFEETGLRIDAAPRLLFTETVAGDTDLWILRSTKVFSRPDTEGFDWITLRRGIRVQKVRETDGFMQIAYEEWDDEDNPHYVSYAFTGWVAKQDVSNSVDYRFFRLDATMESERWSKLSDNHVLEFEWRSMSDLPPLFGLQETWKDPIVQALRGRA